MLSTARRPFLQVPDFTSLLPEQGDVYRPWVARVRVSKSMSLFKISRLCSTAQRLAASRRRNEGQLTMTSSDSEVDGRKRFQD